MSRILVTGANGFVGRYLCLKMQRQGWQVRGAVRTSCYLPSGVAPVSVGMLNGVTDWTEALRDLTTVIHLAARVHVMHDDAVGSIGRVSQSKCGRNGTSGSLSSGERSEAAGLCQLDQGERRGDLRRE